MYIKLRIKSQSLTTVAHLKTERSLFIQVLTDILANLYKVGDRGTSAYKWVDMNDLVFTCKYEKITFSNTLAKLDIDRFLCYILVSKTENFSKMVGQLAISTDEYSKMLI